MNQPPKASKTRRFDDSRTRLGVKTSNHGIPLKLEDFIEIANAVPPNDRSRLTVMIGASPVGGASLADRYAWLKQSQLSPFVPTDYEEYIALREAIAAHEAGSRKVPVPSMGSRANEALQRDWWRVPLWAEALRFIVQTLEEIIRVQNEPYDARADGYGRIKFNHPALGEQLKIGAEGELIFVPEKSEITQVLENFRRSLAGAIAGRIRTCLARFRGDELCGRFFYAKRHDQQACLPAHAQLMRSKKSYRKKTEESGK